MTRLLRTAVNVMLGRVEPTLVEQKRAWTDSPVIINGQARQPELKRIFYGPTCKWPIVKD